MTQSHHEYEVGFMHDNYVMTTVIRSVMTFLSYQFLLCLNISTLNHFTASFSIHINKDPFPSYFYSVLF